MATIKFTISNGNLNIDVNGKEKGSCRDEANAIIEKLNIAKDTEQIFDKESDVVVNN